MSDKTILILGASVRAAAMSAARAGLSPFGIDLFADRDLQRLCPCIRVDVRDYPHGLFAAADQAPPGPWMYTGGLENHPDLVDDLAARRPLWGNPGSVLGRVRDPFELHRVLASAGLDMPEVRATAEGLPTDGSWLVKPIRSGGGRDIREWRRASTVDAEPVYWQRRADGVPHSAIYCGDGRTAVMLGISRQLIGLSEWFSPGKFTYCGSAGPVNPGARVTPTVRRIGERLAGEFGLTGLFGVDFLLDGSAVLPVEVNPRYTASVEVFEFAHRLPAVEFHRLGCRGDPLLPYRPPTDGPCVGKAVMYARGEWTAPNTDDWLLMAGGDRPGRADIPRSGEVIPAGAPIMTWLGGGNGMAEVFQRMSWAARVLRLELFPDGESPEASQY